ncbi:MAG TPA: FkbM family methyltransferase [Saprospiraceae bacterium]|nr:FkbM family methyltransferase [Saprospiraceae bacterium]HNT19440.1 FkbM family methyltransferase [Saprospiraceae bacterium]
MGKLLNKFSKFCQWFLLTSSIKTSLKLLGKSNGQEINFQFHGNDLFLRKNEADLAVFESVFQHKHHRSVVKLFNDYYVIVDLGSNIGLTLIDYAEEYKNAKIYGVELDFDNYEIAKKNINSFRNIFLINAGIWNEDGWVHYEGKDPQSFAISDSAIGTKVPSITMTSLIKKFGLKKIDYLKMDIEGAEYQIFKKDIDWLYLVECLNIEIHDTIEIKKEDGISIISEILKGKGFNVFTNSNHWSSISAYK